MLTRRTLSQTINRRGDVFEVRLHGALWKRVAEPRAAEWRRALEELNASNAIRLIGEPVEDPALELVQPPDESFHVRVYQEGFELIRSVALDSKTIEGFFDEYATTIRQMVLVDKEAPVRGFEAIDYAKRVVHDEAGGYLLESLEGVVEMELPDARRLFTLIFLVGTDLPEALVRYHRRH